MRTQEGTITITGNTRAKARALRDATNIGMTALEELGGDDDEPAPARRSAPAKPAPPQPQQQNGTGALATKAQIDALYNMAKVHGRWSEAAVNEWIAARASGRKPGQLTKVEFTHCLTILRSELGMTGSIATPANEATPPPAPPRGVSVSMSREEELDYWSSRIGQCEADDALNQLGNEIAAAALPADVLKNVRASYAKRREALRPTPTPTPTN